MKKILLVVLISLNLFGSLNSLVQTYKDYKSKRFSIEDLFNAARTWRSLESGVGQENSINKSTEESIKKKAFKELREDIDRALEDYSTNKKQYKDEIKILNQLKDAFKPSIIERAKDFFNRVRSWLNKNNKVLAEEASEFRANAEKTFEKIDVIVKRIDKKIKKVTDDIKSAHKKSNFDEIGSYESRLNELERSLGDLASKSENLKRARENLKILKAQDKVDEILENFFNKHPMDSIDAYNRDIFEGASKELNFDRMLKSLKGTEAGQKWADKINEVKSKIKSFDSRSRGGRTGVEPKVDPNEGDDDF